MQWRKKRMDCLSFRYSVVFGKAPGISPSRWAMWHKSVGVGSTVVHLLTRWVIKQQTHFLLRLKSLATLESLKVAWNKLAHQIPRRLSNHDLQKLLKLLRIKTFQCHFFPFCIISQYQISIWWQCVNKIKKLYTTIHVWVWNDCYHCCMVWIRLNPL